MKESKIAKKGRRGGGASAFKSLESK